MTPSRPEGSVPPVPVAAHAAAPPVELLPSVVAALRAERVRIGHWRGLVRARTDLAVASIALPEELGRHRPDALAVLDEGAVDVPPYLLLLDAVSTGGPQGEIDRLESLRALDARLARYEAAVTRALRVAVGTGLPQQGGDRPAAATREPGSERPGPGPMGQTVPRT